MVRTSENALAVAKIATADHVREHVDGFFPQYERAYYTQTEYHDPEIVATEVGSAEVDLVETFHEASEVGVAALEAAVSDGQPIHGTDEYLFAKDILDRLNPEEPINTYAFVDAINTVNGIIQLEKLHARTIPIPEDYDLIITPLLVKKAVGSSRKSLIAHFRGNRIINYLP